MLPRPARLHRTQDITAVLRHGQRSRTPWVRLYYRPGRTAGTRVACIVGRQVDPSAVRRKRYQRWLREIARQALASTHAPYDMVWVARPEIRECRSLAALREQIASSLPRGRTASRSL